MEKPYSEIIGLPISVDHKAKIARITDILIDTNDGRVAAFFVSSGKMKIISPNDIIFFGATIVIDDFEDIIDVEDLVKANNALKKDIPVMKNRVETAKGDHLGKVQDYFIDANGFFLTKIVVHQTILGLLKTPDRLIPARDIIEFKKNVIVVKNKYAKKPIPVEEERLRKLHPDIA